MLIKIAPVPMSKVHFTSSGSEANDLAAKMVWYRSNALGKRDKKKIIGRLKGYHGVTIAAASITGLPRNHESFDLPLDRMIHTSCPSYVHFAKAGESETEFTARMLHDLESLILKEGPETIAAFWGEPVMGAGGVLMPPAGYWEGVQAILNKYDILLVADEVICGFGRTGKMFACETFNIRPDVLVVSKQITSSYMPLSAILMNDRFYQPIADESDRIGSFGHGYTASGHPVATAVGLENLKIIQERDLVGHVADLQDTFLVGTGGACQTPRRAFIARHRPDRRIGDQAVDGCQARRCCARRCRSRPRSWGDYTQHRRSGVLLSTADHYSGADQRYVRSPWGRRWTRWPRGAFERRA